MSNGLTWEEETTARIKNAREKQRRAEGLRKQVETDAIYWGRYADTLEQVLELEKQIRNMKPSTHYVLDLESLRKKSIREALIEIATANNGLLVATDAVTILLDANIFVDRDQARSALYAAISRSKRCFRKERRGIYRLAKPKHPRLMPNI